MTTTRKRIRFRANQHHFTATIFSSCDINTCIYQQNGYKSKLQQFMNTPGAIIVQIIWNFGILVLCGFSIWQIFAIGYLDAAPSQDFMKLSYPDQNAKFRHGAMANGAVANRVTGINGASQRRDMRVFLIVITAFAVPAAVFILLRLFKSLTKYPATASAKPDWLDKVRDFVMAV